MLITLEKPVSIPLALGVRRSIRRIGLHVDEPDAFLAALEMRPAAGGRPDASRLEGSGH